MLAFVWAETKNGIIGSDGKLPWHIPDDMHYFKELTTGHPVIMGRKTFESFGGKPLPNRLNIVLTRKDTLKETQNLKVSHSVKELIEAYASSQELIFVIGGREIYQQFYPYVTRLYRTYIDMTISGDTKMIPIDYKQWCLVASHHGVGPAQQPIPHTFEIYERKIDLKNH